MHDTRFCEASSLRSSILFVSRTSSALTLFSLSVHSLCFPSPWFVSSQTISSTPLSFCSLALLSNPMVCVFTNHPFCTVLFLFTRSAFHPHGLCLHKPSILHRSLSVHSLCFPSPWFVSSQSINSAPFSFCSLALLSIPMVCVFTNHPFYTVLFLFSRSAFHPHGLCLHKPKSRSNPVFFAQYLYLR